MANSFTEVCTAMDFSAQLYLCTLGKLKKQQKQNKQKHHSVIFKYYCCFYWKLHLDRIISAGLLWLKQRLHDDYQSSSLWHYVHCKLADQKVSWVKSSQRLLHHPKVAAFLQCSIIPSTSPVDTNFVLSSKSASANLKLNDCRFNRLHLNP